MDEPGDGAEIGVRGCEHRGDAVDDADDGILRCGGHLGEVHAVGAGEDDVGERAADVDAEHELAVGHGVTP